ncbi:unnamed protein product, partial [Wuchereria bancrofti]
FSSFTPAEQEELRRKASRIHDGATFQSFDEFHECFEVYMIVWNYPYRIASSELLRDGEESVINRFKYKYVVYHCAHYGTPRKRGKGERINQNYLSLGCTARFRLNADTTNGCLRISSFHEKHTNHECTEEDYLRIINKKRRNLTGGIASKIVKEEKMRETGETKSTCKSPELNERANVSDVAEDNSVPVISSAQSSSLIISSQENSAFVPVTRSAEVSKQLYTKKGETKSTCKSPELNERANVSDVAEDNSVPVISSAQSSSLIISSQENSAFVPVTRSAEVSKQLYTKKGL